MASQLLPDLHVLESYMGDYEVFVENNRTMLRFSTAMSNQGQGAFEIRGGEPPVVVGEDEENVFQRVYNDDGTFSDREAGTFEFHPEHGHVHYNGFAGNRLRARGPNGEVGELVATGTKTSFALLDLVRFDAALPGSPENTVYNSGGRVQGISVGWADVYNRFLEGQSIDVTGIAPGDYWLEVEADPDNAVLESDETNNLSRIPITRGPDVLPFAGLEIDSSTPRGATAGAVDHVRVTFNKPIDPATFALDDVSFSAEGADVPITEVVPMAATNNTSFRIGFAPQAAIGTYTMNIGPNIMAADGDLLDGNRSGTGGEPGDVYVVIFTITEPRVIAGPDGTGHQVLGPAAPSEIDLEPGDPGVVVTIDNSDDSATSIDLGQNTFTFHGNSYTGPDQLFVSTNGLISFIQGNAAYANDTLADMDAPTLAVLWDDWSTNADDLDQVLHRFVDADGDGQTEKLIVEWSRVVNIDAPGSGRATFQAALSLNTGAADGEVLLTYADLDLGNADYDDGRSATVGLSAGNATEPLVVSFNGSSSFVHDSTAIRIEQLPGPDIRVRSATADGVATLTVTYDIVGGPVASFHLTFLRSADSTASSDDAVLSQITIHDPADLSVGAHTLTFTIGRGTGQVRLPGVGATETNSAYQVLAVVDRDNQVAELDADPLAEDNTQTLVGAYLASNQHLLVFGSGRNDVIVAGVSEGELQVTVNGSVSSRPQSQVRQLRIRAAAGNDQVVAEDVPVAVVAWGEDGDDALAGGSAADTLDGGAGDDLLVGGADNDSYAFDADDPLGTDRLVEAANGGRDTLNFAATTTVGVQIDLSQAEQFVHQNLNLNLAEPAAFENIRGTQQADVLIGNPGANRLEGLAGDDTLDGGLGNDVLLFDTDSHLGSDTLLDAGGTDTLNFAPTTTQGVTIDLGSDDVQVVNAQLTLTLAAGNPFESAVGGSLADTLRGNASSNVLIGHGGNDLLIGLAGKDALQGGSGDDTMNGGAGDDTYRFRGDQAQGADQVVENPGEGVDWLDFAGTTGTGITVDLSSTGVQAVSTLLTLQLSSGEAVENVVGTAQADVIAGNSQTNILEGLAGDDQLTGAGGRDVLLGGSGADTLAGGDEEDLLIGSTAEGLARGSLAAVGREWSGVRNQDARRARLSAALLIPGTTVADDGVDDSLAGDAGRDWFFGKLGEVADLTADETVSVV